MVTTASGMIAAVGAMDSLRAGTWGVRSLQEYFPAEQTVGMR